MLGAFDLAKMGCRDVAQKSIDSSDLCHGTEDILPAPHGSPRFFGFRFSQCDDSDPFLILDSAGVIDTGAAGAV